MDKEEKKALKIVILFFVILFALITSIGVTHSYFEAKAFNEATGKNVTTWQAIFLDLRIMEPAKT